MDFMITFSTFILVTSYGKTPGLHPDGGSEDSLADILTEDRKIAWPDIRTKDRKIPWPDIRTEDGKMFVWPVGRNISQSSISLSLSDHRGTR